MGRNNRVGPPTWSPFGAPTDRPRDPDNWWENMFRPERPVAQPTTQRRKPPKQQGHPPASTTTRRGRVVAEQRPAEAPGRGLGVGLVGDFRSWFEPSFDAHATVDIHGGRAAGSRLAGPLSVRNGIANADLRGPARGLGVNVTGLVIRNGEPVSARWLFDAGIFSFGGDRAITAADRNGEPTNATVRLQDLVGSIRLEPRRNARGEPIRSNITARVNGDRLDFTIDMDVANGQFGDPERRGLRIGAGRVRLTGFRTANGQVQVNIERIDAPARLRVPAGGSTDTIEMDRLVARQALGEPRLDRRGRELKDARGNVLRHPPRPTFVFQNGVMVEANVQNAEAHRLRTSVTVANPTAPQQTARLNITEDENSERGATVRRINFRMARANQHPTPPGRAPITHSIEFSTTIGEERTTGEQRGVHVRLVPGTTGLPISPADGLNATLLEGTTLTAPAGATIRVGALMHRDRTLSGAHFRFDAGTPDPAHPDQRREIVLRTNSRVTGVDQLIGASAIANFDVAANGTLAVSHFDSRQATYDFRLGFKVDPRVHPGSVNVSELPAFVNGAFANVDPARLVSGTLDRPELRLNLAVRRGPAAPGSSQQVMTFEGGIMGAFPSGHFHAPLGNGLLDLRVTPAVATDGVEQPRAQFFLPIRASFGTNGRITIPPILSSTATRAACVAALDENSTVSPVAMGCTATLTGNRSNFELTHFDGPRELNPGVVDTVAEQERILAEARLRLEGEREVTARLAAAQAADEARLTEVLDVAGRRLNVNAGDTTGNIDTDVRRFDVAAMLQRARTARITADIPLTEPTAEDIAAGRAPQGQDLQLHDSNFLRDVRLRIPPDTRLRVTTIPGENGAERINLAFVNAAGEARPVTLSGSSFFGYYPGSANIASLQITRNGTGDLSITPTVVGTPTGANILSYIEGDLASRLRANLGRPSRRNPRDLNASFAASLISASARAADARIDAEDNAALRVWQTIAGTQNPAFWTRALQRMSIADASITLPAGTPLVAGNNFINLAGETTVRLTKAADSPTITAIAQNVLLGPTNVRAGPGRFIQFAGARVAELRLDTTVEMIGDRPQTTQAFAFRGIDTRVPPPGGGAPVGARMSWVGDDRQTWSVGPAHVTGDFSVTLSPRRAPEPVPELAPRLAAFATQARGGLSRIPTFGVDLRVTGPVTIQGLDIGDPTSQDGSANIQTLRLDARDTAISFHGNRLNVSSETGNRAELTYSARLRATQPQPMIVNFGANSHAIGTLFNLGFTFDEAQATREDTVLRMDNLVAITPTASGAVTGELSFPGVPVTFTSSGALMVAPTVDVGPGRRTTVISALELRDSVLTSTLRPAVPGGPGPHQDARVAGRMLLSLDRRLRRARTNAEDDPGINANGGMFSMLNADFSAEGGIDIELPFSLANVDEAGADLRARFERWRQERERLLRLQQTRR